MQQPESPAEAASGQYRRVCAEIGPKCLGSPLTLGINTIFGESHTRIGWNQPRPQPIEISASPAT
jgi:hypothetical protein